ncbi:MAG: hypothetical protein MI921_30010 [Cytophagales bacterium]|nr:hypothetical protein [Cytophagales bacterium]
MVRKRLDERLLNLSDFNPYTILCGDVIEMMNTIPDSSIHCIITSPPYWQKRDYGFKNQ